jgi:hypothetical protein
VSYLHLASIVTENGATQSVCYVLHFDNATSFAYGVVFYVLKSGNQAAEYGVEFNFQLLSFSPAAEEIEQSAPKVGVGKVGEGVFELGREVKKILGDLFSFFHG